SGDKVNFEAITVVDAAGNSSTANTYNFLHRDAPNGVNYYRLDQTDFDGRTTSSTVISLVRGEGGFGIVEVLPVPARDFVNLTFTSTDNTEVTGRLHDVSGKVLANFKVNAKGGLNTIKVDVSRYPIGVYLLTINNGSELLSTKVIKE
ncbi:MAG: T9SS type A sorting domain-containing protein, partial [Chitinophagales bacterium]